MMMQQQHNDHKTKKPPQPQHQTTLNSSAARPAWSGGPKRDSNIGDGSNFSLYPPHEICLLLQKKAIWLPNLTSPFRLWPALIELGLQIAIIAAIGSPNCPNLIPALTGRLFLFEECRSGRFLNRELEPSYQLQPLLSASHCVLYFSEAQA